MRLSVLNEHTLLLEQYRQHCRSIVLEATHNMTPDQKTVFNEVYSTLYPIVEATLTQDQIEKVINGLVAKQTKQPASNTSPAAPAQPGQVAQVVSNIQAKVNQLKDKIQQSEPVKDFDKKFEQLKTQISQKLGDDSKIKAAVKAIGDYAKEHPAITSAAIAVMTIAASLAGGPFAAAAAASLLTSSIEMFKGENLSSAGGKGLVSGATGLLSAAAVTALGAAISEPMKIVASSINPEIAAIDYTKMTVEVGNQFKDQLGNLDGGMVVGKHEDIKELKSMWDAAGASFDAGNYSKAHEQFAQAREIAQYMASDDYTSRLVSNEKMAGSLAAGSEAVSKFFGALSSVAQAAASGKVAKESVDYSITEENVRQIAVALNEKIDAGALVRATTGALKKVASTAKTAVTKTSKSPEKIIAAWKKAKSPTDSNEFGKFLLTLGFTEEDISAVFKEVGLEPFNPTLGRIKELMGKLHSQEIQYVQYYFLDDQRKQK